MTSLILFPHITSRIRIVIILLAALSLSVCKSCAQSRKPHIMVSAILEKTIVEKQAGGSICWQLPSLWRIGGFYQSTIDNRVEGTENATFWGALLAAPIVKSGKLNFYLTIRSGYANNIFFLTTPGLLTEIKISHRLSFDIGVSIRKGYLSANSNLNFRF